MMNRPNNRGLILVTAGALLALAGCGGGGGTTTPIGGGPGGLNLYHPAVTVPATETWRDMSTAGDSAAARWLKNSVETLPADNFQNASLQQWASLIFNGINAERMNAGLPGLQYEPHLELSAQAHARDMALRDFFAHDTPEGLTPGARLGFLNSPETIRWLENAAKGQESAAEVVSGWMGSQKHREHILNGEVTHMGIGVYYDPADRDMPIHVIADFASFYSAPESNDWYQRGDVL